MITEYAGCYCFDEQHQLASAGLFHNDFKHAGADEGHIDSPLVKYAIERLFWQLISLPTAD